MGELKLNNCAAAVVKVRYDEARIEQGAFPVLKEALVNMTLTASLQGMFQNEEGKAVSALWQLHLHSPDWDKDQFSEPNLLVMFLLFAELSDVDFQKLDQERDFSRRVFTTLVKETAKVQAKSIRDITRGVWASELPVKPEEIESAANQLLIWRTDDDSSS